MYSRLGGQILKFVDRLVYFGDEEPDSLLAPSDERFNRLTVVKGCTLAVVLKEAHIADKTATAYVLGLVLSAHLRLAVMTKEAGLAGFRF